MTLTASDFDYPLAAELIADEPAEPRDRSRLMVLRRADGRTRHRRFFELDQVLRTGDLLVVNDTRVIPAKFTCRRSSGGKIDGLFLREELRGRWEVLLRNAGRCKVAEGLLVDAAEEVELRLREDLGQGRWMVSVRPSAPAEEILQRVGSTPLPPYIRRDDPTAEAADRMRYQTIYADRPGAVAAPTAGLHFTEALFGRLALRGIETTEVTLHVGLGTFAPLKTEDLRSHDMHAEWYKLPARAARKINAARKDRRRVVAVGTTSVRVLEAAARQRRCPDLGPSSGWTKLFLYPPAEFRAVDALITNFHLPRSTLLMLAAAFCSPGRTDGLETILGAYAEARRLRYRFYSYGDAMLIE